MLRKLLLSVVTIILAFLTALVSVYSEAIRQGISTYLGICDVTIAFYVIIISLALLLIVCVLLVIHSIYRFFKFGVVIQKDSLQFNKYPYFVSSQGKIVKMTNMSYSEITVHNKGKTKIDECGLKISLKREKKDYTSRVLSSDSTVEPNPITTSVDGDGKKGFHPVCLSLDSFHAFLPNHSLGEGGAFDWNAGRPR